MLRKIIIGPFEMPATEKAARTNHALPMGIDLTEEQIREVVGACASGST